MKLEVISFKHNNKEYKNVNISDVKIQEKLKKEGIDVLQIVKEIIINKFLYLKKKRIEQILVEFGFISLSEVIVFSLQDRKQAKDIINWLINKNSIGYSDLLQMFIEINVIKEKNINKLLSIDIEKEEERIFNQSVVVNKLNLNKE